MRNKTRGDYMKKISVPSLCMAALLFVSASAFGQGSAPSAKKTPGLFVMAGKVLKVMNAGGYTYAKIQNSKGNLWLAMPQAKLKVGDTATFYPGTQMMNFHSDTLNRTFKKVMFTSGLVALPGTKAYRTRNRAKQAAEKVKVTKAQGANGRTIAEIYKDKAALGGKTVSVRGKVVKVSKGIMGSNWLHIQDGTGDVSKGTNSLVVTTKDDADAGDVVTATGVITPDKDFGFGYKYDVIMEQAKIKK